MVNYIITETTSGEKMGIAVNKTGTSQVNSVYKFGIMGEEKQNRSQTCAGIVILSA